MTLTAREAPASEAASSSRLAQARGRVWLIGIILSVLGIRWLVYSLLVREAGGIELGFIILLGLVTLQPLLRRVLPLSRADVLLIYCFVVIASGCYDGVSRFLPVYTVPTYFAAPENRYAEIAEMIPAWFVPKDPEVIREMYEGAEDGRVPWAAWRGPVLRWWGFFLLLWVTLLGLTLLFRRQWAERERLAFPLVTVPLSLTAEAGTGYGRAPGGAGPRSLWRDPLFWLGGGISFFHFLTIMLHALNPAIPTLGNSFDVGQFFTEKPLDGLRPFFLFVYNPFLVGLAYFAPRDLCFSMFFFHFVIKGVMLFYRIMGYREPSGFPFFWEQSAGAFLGIALFFIWTARPHLAAVLRAAVVGEGRGEGKTEGTAEPFPYRLVLLGAILGLVGLCAWYVAVGMSWWVAVPFFGMVLLFALVFTRGRAESGVPSLASFPFWQASRQLKSFLGSGPLVVNGSYKNLTYLASLIFLHFGLYPETMTFQLESLKIGQEARINLRSVTWIVLLAMALGLGVMLHSFLTVDYQYGVNVLAGGTTEGGYHVSIARTEYDEVQSVMQGQPLARDWNRNGYTLGAFVLTVGLILLRARFLRFPLHPLGYVMTSSYGYAYWGPFLTVWLCQTLFLRLGGVRLYRRLRPLFIGLIVGQIFTLSVVWQLFAAAYGPEWQRAADPLSYF